MLETKEGWAKRSSQNSHWHHRRPIIAFIQRSSKGKDQKKKAKSEEKKRKSGYQEHRSEEEGGPWKKKKQRKREESKKKVDADTEEDGRWSKVMILLSSMQVLPQAERLPQPTQPRPQAKQQKASSEASLTWVLGWQIKDFGRSEAQMDSRHLGWNWLSRHPHQPSSFPTLWAIKSDLLCISFLRSYCRDGMTRLARLPKLLSSLVLLQTIVDPYPCHSFAHICCVPWRTDATKEEQRSIFAEEAIQKLGLSPLQCGRATSSPRIFPGLVGRKRIAHVWTSRRLSAKTLMPLILHSPLAHDYQ